MGCCRHTFASVWWQKVGSFLSRCLMRTIEAAGQTPQPAPRPPRPPSPSGGTFLRPQTHLALVKTDWPYLKGTNFGWDDGTGHVSFSQALAGFLHPKSSTQRFRSFLRSWTFPAALVGSDRTCWFRTSADRPHSPSGSRPSTRHPPTGNDQRRRWLGRRRGLVVGFWELLLHVFASQNLAPKNPNHRPNRHPFWELHGGPSVPGRGPQGARQLE